jgi:hypothetical protein
MPIIGSFGAGSGRGYGQRGGPGLKYICATGGSITECGDYKIHTFTGPGTFTVNSEATGTPCAPNTVDYLVIAGGGSGGVGKVDPENGGGGGGGAGGYRESSGAASGCYSASPKGSGVPGVTVSAQSYPISVGGGASSALPGSPWPGTQGTPSTALGITSTGGGGGKGGPGVNGGPAANTGSGQPGGSGGGGSSNANCHRFAGSGNSPPVSPPQGNPGGDGYPTPCGTGGGGGGAASAGVGSGNFFAGPGGDGATSSINGSPVTRGGGGGGAVYKPPFTLGSGGPGGGGNANNFNNNAQGGTGGTGSGGGAASGGNSGTGGSGRVIIRYKFQ